MIINSYLSKPNRQSILDLYHFKFDCNIDNIFVNNFLHSNSQQSSVFPSRSNLFIYSYQQHSFIFFQSKQMYGYIIVKYNICAYENNTYPPYQMSIFGNNGLIAIYPSITIVSIMIGFFRCY